MGESVDVPLYGELILFYGLLFLGVADIVIAHYSVIVEIIFGKEAVKSYLPASLNSLSWPLLK